MYKLITQEQQHAHLYLLDLMESCFLQVLLFMFFVIDGRFKKNILGIM